MSVVEENGEENIEDANEPSQIEPDQDTIKMFVGQIPRNWTEEQCRELFEQFGPVHQLNILRDKATQSSKGCCFVTFYHRKDAIDAQCSLHNIKTLPQMHHPVQMKPADSENHNERKLFVGMICKKSSEDDLRKLFTGLGVIEDCTVLKDGEGRSKGCAFVTFATRTSAQNAIRQMHHAVTMEGCSMPLVVKFADTQKEKDAKRAQQFATQMSPSLMAINRRPAQSYMQGPFGGMPNVNPNSMVGNMDPQLTALNTLLQQVGSHAGSQNVLSLLGNVLTGLGKMNGVPKVPQHLQQQQHQHQVGMTPAGISAVESVMAAISRGGGSVGDGGRGGQSSSDSGAVIQQQQQQQRIYELNQLLAGSGSGSGIPASSKESLSSANGPPMANNLITLTGSAGQNSIDALRQVYSGMQQYSGAFPQLGVHQQSQNLAQQQLVGKQNEGPDGSNLFIYHLPQEFNDCDLLQTFAAFGSIVSAKVFIDKQTNLSKCFGFVSYDNAPSAQQAIQSMNGFQIGTKRLKVQLKRSKSEGKPYQNPGHSSATI